MLKYIFFIYTNIKMSRVYRMANHVPVKQCNDCDAPALVQRQPERRNTQPFVAIRRPAPINLGQAFAQVGQNLTEEDEKTEIQAAIRRLASATDYGIYGIGPRKKKSAKKSKKSSRKAKKSAKKSSKKSSKRSRKTKKIARK